MKREFRLKDDDMLQENHFPVKAIFNMVNDERFLKVLTGISDGKGFGENYGACVFPDDLDEYEIVTNGIFEGVKFGLHNGEEIVIGYKEMLYYLSKICNDYILDYPESKFEIEKLLEKYKDKFINNN